MEVKPISSLDALLSWGGPGKLKNFLNSLPPLAPRSKPVSTLQPSESTPKFKTLVCHDMKNGYLDDKFLFGGSDSTAYRFYHWNSLDTFVYFSHHFITIPPCGWVKTAHNHGVKVLGTIITEWGAGEAIWEVILNDDAVMELVINNLLEIARAYRFEGWLLNVENKIKPDKVKDLLYFTSELARRMRHQDPLSEVIWYDSVTCDGDLSWQNELNDKNRGFFDACDGIFLNYSWRESNLVNSAENAAGRISDVYVGVDVYGRNFYEGGGFNLHKALMLVRKHLLSTAIFAQGWTHEVLGASEFFSNENKLWESLERFLLYRGPTRIPLATSFCQGFGKNLYHRGKVSAEGEWFNLSKQQLQPNWEEISRLSGRLCSISTDKAFEGGSCLTVWVDDIMSVRLMVCQIQLVPNMEFVFAYKVVGAVKYLSFNFPFDGGEDEEEEEGDGEERELCLVAETEEEESSLLPRRTFLPEHKGEENGWLIRRYSVKERKGSIKGFVVKVEGTGLVMFGELSIDQLKTSS